LSIRVCLTDGSLNLKFSVYSTTQYDQSINLIFKVLSKTGNN